MTARNFLAVALASGIAAAGPPPPELPLSLAEARALALEKNVELRVERETAAIAEAGELRAKGAYDPVLTADARWRERTDPVNSILSGAPEGELAPTTSGFGASLGLVKLLPTGGSVAFSSSVFRERTDGAFAVLSPSWTTSFGVELRQPLLRNRATDAARLGLRVARVDRVRSAAAVRRVASETVAAVERAYWALVAARSDVEARRSAVELAERQRADVEARIEAGTLSEADRAAPLAEVERRRGEHLAARETEARAENALKALLLSDPADSFWESRIVTLDEAEEAVSPAVDAASDAVAAGRSRPEVAEAAARLEQLVAEEEAAGDRVRPQLDLVAGYAGRGLAGDRNPDIAPPFPVADVAVPAALDGGLGRSLGTIGEGRFPDASVGLAFSLPLGNRVARADAARVRSARAQAELALLRVRQQVAIEARNAAVALETAGQRLVAARAGSEAAAALLRAEEERFAAGLTTSFFVLTRQNDLTLARVAETRALSDLRRARVEYARATGTLLSERQIHVDATGPDPGAAGGSR